eukprot:Sspe_Gene.98441::Locus_71857_Transcript_1_1_Confidence_1.000_Length_1325::g.98441::m.98441
MANGLLARALRALVVKLNSSFTLGMFTAFLLTCGLWVGGIVGVNLPGPPPPHVVVTTRPPKMNFHDFCAARDQQYRGKPLPKTVVYLKAGYPIEQYIRRSFSELGYTEVRSPRLATFLIGKATAEQIRWEVCANTMKHNHIPGQRGIVTKDGLFESLRKVDGRKGTHMRWWEIVKETFLVYKPEECGRLMALVEAMPDRPPGEDSVVFIQKALRGGHNGKGLALLNTQMMKQMLHNYKSTGRCANGQRVILQRFLNNPLLIRGRTFSLRLYFHVVRTSPALVLYHDGYVRVTRAQYNKSSTDAQRAISNFEKVWSGNSTGEADMGEKHFLTLKELEEYAVRSHGVEDGWLNNYLRPRFMSMFAHIYRALEPSLKKESTQYFGLFAPDVTLDESLNPWIFEVNFSPELSRFVPLEHIPEMYKNII